MRVVALCALVALALIPPAQAAEHGGKLAYAEIVKRDGTRLDGMVEFLPPGNYEMNEAEMRLRFLRGRPTGPGPREPVSIPVLSTPESARLPWTDLNWQENLEQSLRVPEDAMAIDLLALTASERQRRTWSSLQVTVAGGAPCHPAQRVEVPVEQIASIRYVFRPDEAQQRDWWSRFSNAAARARLWPRAPEAVSATTKRYRHGEALCLITAHLDEDDESAMDVEYAPPPALAASAQRIMEAYLVQRDRCGPEPTNPDEYPSVSFAPTTPEEEAFQQSVFLPLVQCAGLRTNPAAYAGKRDELRQRAEDAMKLTLDEWHVREHFHKDADAEEERAGWLGF